MFYYNKENKLTAYGALSCDWRSPVSLRCLLSDKKWSDGSPIRPKDYINTYAVIKSQKEESGTFLSNIESVTAKNNSLVFKLKVPDEHFRHELTNVYFKPRKEKKLYKKTKGMLFSGPYKLKRLTKSFIELTANPYFSESSTDLPPVKGLFIDDPSAALNLHAMGKLDFLRYLETSNIPKFPNRYMAPFARLDGIFFSPKHIKDENLKKALLYSLDFKALQKIFFSPSMPGCMSLPSSFFKSPLPCFERDIKKAKEFFLKAQKHKKRKHRGEIKSISLFIPSMSSDDHKKLAQWARESWKNTLGLHVNIEQMEAGAFYESLRQEKLPIYRKSVSLKNLTCREAKEIVLTQPEFKEMKKEVHLELPCDDFFKIVLAQHMWVPLGMPSFAHLHAKDYSGYYINMLGQFGLEDLRLKEKDL